MIFSQDMTCLHMLAMPSRHVEEEEEAFYIRVPSPIGLIGWNIQRKTKHKR